jgi:hypothetical protein
MTICLQYCQMWMTRTGWTIRSSFRREKRANHR